MATVAFTPQLRRFLAVSDADTCAATLREAIEAAFALSPRPRGYVLDDQGHLLANVVVFIDGRRSSDRMALADPPGPYSGVHVLQALSGGCGMDSQRAWVANRKGFFELQRSGRDWRIVRISFLGEPVSMLLPPQDGKRTLATLNLGHFGVKLHASEDAGASWQEVAAPSCPPQPDGAGGPPWTLQLLWSLEAAHGIVWAGTLPGGLFRSADFGQCWQLVDALWNRPERAE